MKIIFFLEPIFKEMIWGGDKLASEFGYEITGNHIGECWAIAAHSNGDTKVICDAFHGYTLSRLWCEHREFFGNISRDVYPLLVKIIDARTDLSIQVHPDDEYAAKNETGSLGKTECWYILDCEKDATIIIGHNAKTKNDAKRMIEEKHWDEFLREIKIQKGDFFQIEPGCIHAIKGGTMILETQQNSDITYRLYDYDRLTPDGKLRELHTDKALDVIKIPFQDKCINHTLDTLDGYTRELLINCPYYSVERVAIQKHAEITQSYNFMNVSVIDGNGTIDGKDIGKGSHFILPYDYGTAKFEGEMELIISYI